MAITQKIQQFPPAPNSATDTPVEFNGKADAFVHHQADTYVTEVNTWATQANALEGEMTQIKTDIDTIVGTIPTGSIDDSKIAAGSVWSSQKVDSELKGKQDASPEWGIDSGTDGNGGHYVRFPDGTLIYTRTGKFTSGVLVFGLTGKSVFVDTNFSVSATIETSTDGATVTVTSKTATNIALKGEYRTGTSWNAATQTCTITATGRWK